MALQFFFEFLPLQPFEIYCARGKEHEDSLYVHVDAFDAKSCLSTAISFLSCLTALFVTLPFNQLSQSIPASHLFHVKLCLSPAIPFMSVSQLSLSHCPSIIYLNQSLLLIFSLEISFCGNLHFEP